jgi:hypothetical protein
MNNSDTAKIARILNNHDFSKATAWNAEKLGFWININETDNVLESGNMADDASENGVSQHSILHSSQV